MYYIYARPHKLGHCGAENKGSSVVGKQYFDGFETELEANTFLLTLSDPCPRCRGYQGTIADPDHCYVKFEREAGK
jgi:hypothetical protein